MLALHGDGRVGEGAFGAGVRGPDTVERKKLQ